MEHTRFVVDYPQGVYQSAFLGPPDACALRSRAEVDNLTPECDAWARMPGAWCKQNCDTRPTFDERGDDGDCAMPIACRAPSPTGPHSAPAIDSDYMAQCDESTWCMYERIVEHRRAVSVDSALMDQQPTRAVARDDDVSPSLNQLESLRHEAAAAGYVHMPPSPRSAGCATTSRPLSYEMQDEDEELVFRLES